MSGTGASKLISTVPKRERTVWAPSLSNASLQLASSEAVCRLISLARRRSGGRAPLPVAAATVDDFPQGLRSATRGGDGRLLKGRCENRITAARAIPDPMNTRSLASRRNTMSFCSVKTARVSSSDVWLVVQNDIQQRAVDLQSAIVIDEAQFTEFIHERTHPRSRRADHFRERLLADLCNDWLRFALLAEVRQEKKSPRQALFARVEQLIDEVRFNSDIPSQKM